MPIYLKSQYAIPILLFLFLMVRGFCLVTKRLKCVGMHCGGVGLSIILCVAALVAAIASALEDDVHIS